MRIGKILLIVVLALLVLGSIAAYMASSHLPVILNTQVKNAFAGLGFYDIDIGDVQVNEDSIRYSSIKLDKDGFSTINNITVTYDLNTVLSKKELNNLHIDGISLTAILDSNGKFEMTGWVPPQFQPFELPVKTFSFSNLVLDIDTIHGALRFKGEGHGVVDKKGNADIQARLDGNQNQLTMSMTMNGRVSPSGAWNMNFQLGNGRLNITDINATRIGGHISMAMENLKSPIKVGGQIGAGRLNISTVSLQNTTAIIKGTTEDYNIDLSGTAGGNRSLSFKAKMAKSSKDGYSGGATIDIKNPTDLAPFISLADKNKNNSANENEITRTEAYLALLPSLKMDIKYLKGESRREMHHPFFLTLGDYNGTLKITSRTEIDLEKKYVAGNIKLPATELQTINKILPLENLLSLNLNKGKIAADGDFFVDFQMQEPVVEGPLKIVLSDISVKNPSASLSGLNGKITLDQISPPKITGKQHINIKEITAGIPIKNAKLDFELLDNQRIKLSGMKGNFAKGSLELEPFQIIDGDIPKRLNISATDIDLATISQMMELDEELKIEGKIDGSLTVDDIGKEIRISRGELHSRPPGGTIIYHPKEYPDFLKGHDQRLEITRNAISNFIYSDLNLIFSGPASGKMKFGAEIKGYNHEIFGNRPIHLNLDMQGDIPALLSGSTKY